MWFRRSPSGLMQNTRFCLQQEGQATEKKISLPEGVACSEGWLEGPRKWVRFGGLLQALWINKCKPGTLFVFFFQGVPTQPMGLGFPLDTQGLWFRVTEGKVELVFIACFLMGGSFCLLKSVNCLFRPLPENPPGCFCPYYSPNSYNR